MFQVIGHPYMTLHMHSPCGPCQSHSSACGMHKTRVHSHPCCMQLLGSIYYGGDWVLLWFLLLGPVLLVTVLLHELGHCMAARSVVR